MSVALPPISNAVEQRFVGLRVVPMLYFLSTGIKNLLCDKLNIYAENERYVSRQIDANHLSFLLLR